MEVPSVRLRDIKPKRLRTLIENFAARHPNQAKPETADGECYIMSELFLLYVRRKKLKLDIALLRADHKPPYDRYGQHWVAIVGGYGVDFTARQFHPHFSFPRVWKDTRKKKAYRLPKSADDPNIDTLQYE
jgi:hypothetical protein